MARTTERRGLSFWTGALPNRVRTGIGHGRLPRKQWTEMYRRGYSLAMFRYRAEEFADLQLSDWVLKNYFRMCSDFLPGWHHGRATRTGGRQ